MKSTSHVAWAERPRGSVGPQQLNSLYISTAQQLNSLNSHIAEDAPAEAIGKKNLGIVVK
jgi:hypothetical protein